MPILTRHQSCWIDFFTFFIVISIALIGLTGLCHRDNPSDSIATTTLGRTCSGKGGSAGTAFIHQQPSFDVTQLARYLESMSNSNGYRSVLYFCNWAIYDRKHFPENLPVDRLTHILYAFSNVNPTTGEVFLTDKWADTDCSASQFQQTKGGGCFGEFTRLKKAHRQLRLLLSVGGWTYSTDLGNGVDSSDKRKAFSQSCIKLLRELCLDGIDIDWEYPRNETDASNYVDLLRELRLELDSEALRKKLPRNQYDLTVAAPGGPYQTQVLKIKEMDQYLTFWNLMTYDFSGPWSNTAGYHSNLYEGELSANKVVQVYLDGGVHPSKLVLGMPIYGRAFLNTTGVGKSYSGIGNGSWEQGVWDYKQLPLNGTTEQVDYEAVSAYCYDEKTKTLVTYENAETARIKARYVLNRKLGGGMWWESSADYPVDDPRCLIAAFTNELGVCNLDTSRPNCLAGPEFRANLSNATNQHPHDSDNNMTFIKPHPNDLPIDDLTRRMRRTYF